MAEQHTSTFDIPRQLWRPYLDGLSAQYHGWRCDVEVISMEVGDQPIAEREQLWGLSWEGAGSAAGSILIETGDPEYGIHEHWVHNPLAVLEANTLPGYEADIQIRSQDGSMVIVRIRRRPELPEGRVGVAREAAGRQGGRERGREGSVRGRFQRAEGTGQPTGQPRGFVRRASRATTNAADAVGRPAALALLAVGVGLVALVIRRGRTERRVAARGGKRTRRAR